MRIIAIAILLGSAATAHADQCQWLDGDVAARAAHELEAHPRYIEYCAPCGDKAPGEPQDATRIVASAHEVAIAGKAIDLAYTYVEVSGTAYANLAALAGCPTTGVPPSLRVDPATVSGVMIRPSDDLVAAQELAPAPTPDPPVEPTEVVYVVHESSTPAWVIALLAGAATSGAWASLALVRKRRRAFKPRAIGLE